MTAVSTTLAGAATPAALASSAASGTTATNNSNHTSATATSTTTTTTSNQSQSNSMCAINNNGTMAATATDAQPSSNINNVAQTAANGQKSATTAAAAAAAAAADPQEFNRLINRDNLVKIESFLNDSAYMEAIENSASYNSRLCRERRLRMPFLDSQTGVAQNHSNLFMSSRERLPGLQHGQLYTYPSKRWRKKRRQYLMNYFHPKRPIRGEIEIDGIEGTDSNIAPGINDDSKDSLALKDEHSKDAWFYDEQDMLDIDPYEEPDPDSDFDYEESYSSKRKRRKPRGGGHHPGRSHPTSSDTPTGKRTKGGGRGRKKANYDPSDSDKPFVCDPMGASSAASLGVKDSADQRSMSPALGRNNGAVPGGGPVGGAAPTNAGPGGSPRPVLLPDGTPMPGVGRQQQQQSAAANRQQQQQQLHRGNHHHAGGAEASKKGKGPAQPSPYCDFCLGDARENKKTGGSEELVSCSDCGRSGKATNGQQQPPQPVEEKTKRKYTRRANNHNL